MNTQQLVTFLLLLGTLAIAIFFFHSQNDSDSPSTDPPPESNGDDRSQIYWGVDSASYTDEELYMCVQDNFGEPEIWGRYLGDKEGVSEGLDTDEVTFLHDHDIHILIIYNHFTDATSYDHGVAEAEEAIQYAKDLDIPESVAIFGDIEPDYPVDSEFLEGWYDTISDSDYNPGIYGVFDEESALLEAFEEIDEEALTGTIVWSAYPQEEMTTKENAPEYQPEGPSEAPLYGWQYAIKAKTCHIDTNLFQENMIDYVWSP